jgi:hypothetical protein
MLTGAMSHLFTVVNFLMTMVGVALVDRKGRKFLLDAGNKRQSSFPW